MLFVSFYVKQQPTNQSKQQQQKTFLKKTNKQNHFSTKIFFFNFKDNLKTSPEAL